MLVSTCGFGNTGASAVLDFLRGYEEVQLIDKFEFQLVHMPDGLLDLKYHIVNNRGRLACNSAIKRFLKLEKSLLAKDLKERGCDYKKIAKEYISSLNPIVWDGYSAYDPYDLTGINFMGGSGYIRKKVKALLKKVNPNWHEPFKERYFLLLEEEEFDELTKKFIKKLFSQLGYDLDKMLIVDQLVSAINPVAGTEFFDNTKIIIVYRDPIDLFMRANTHQATNGFLPCKDVEQFILYYKMLMEKTSVNDDVLCVQYEDLIYNYYPTTQRIMTFLGLTERPSNEFKYFNPNDSVKYTNTIKEKTPDVERLESELGMYKYKFMKYIPVEEQKEQYYREN